MKNMYSVIGSIVLCNNKTEVVEKTIDSFLNTALPVRLYIIDNSNHDKKYKIPDDKRIEYISNGKNVGFGSGHNIAIRKMIDKTKYSLILNPDVYFDSGTLEKLLDFMEENKNTGLVMPKVLYSDGSPQYLCRLLPTPYDLVCRRLNFKIFNRFISSRNDRYELKFADYNRTMDVPYLSGCFMLIRTEIFKKVGIFDERFFMYFEDVDLSRRIYKFYRTVYYPEAKIYHGYHRGSGKYARLLKHHIFSSIKYFNKWGWFMDRERELINNKTLKNLAVR